MLPNSISEPDHGPGRLAAFLHDVVGPSLSSVGLQLEMLRMDYETDARLTARLLETQASVEALMEQVRSFSNSLRFAGPPERSDTEKS